MAKPDPSRLKVTGRITKIVRKGNNWVVTVNRKLEGGKDRYEGGRLTVKRAAADGSDIIVPVLLNTEPKPANITVSQNPNPVNKPVGQLEFELVDDDDPDVLPKLPDVSRLEPELKKAFVLVVIEKDVQDTDCAFLKNLPSGGMRVWEEEERKKLLSYKDLVSNRSHWSFYLFSCFQGRLSEDCDPDWAYDADGNGNIEAIEKDAGEEPIYAVCLSLDGFTYTSSAFLFHEVIRDGARFCGGVGVGKPPAQIEKDIPLHELGWWFKATENDGNIMRRVGFGDGYTDEIIEKIRRATHPYFKEK